MGKYYAIYKCPMCFKELRITENTVEMEEDMLPELLVAVIKHQQFMGSQLYQAPLYVTHKCGNGDGGLAHLVGFRKVQ